MDDPGVLAIRRERALANLGLYERCVISLTAKVLETCERFGMTLEEWQALPFEEREAMCRKRPRKKAAP